MANRFIILGCILAALAVIAGAFGAHALKGILNETYTHTYETAVTYHFYHAFSIIVCGILLSVLDPRRIQIAFRFFFTGIFLFSGSLYALSILVSMGYASFGRLGLITPLGGLCFIAGWLMVAMAAKK